MTAVDVIVGAVGLVLALLAPGFFLARAVAPDAEGVARSLLLGVVLSVAITIMVGAGLGFLGAFRRGTLLGVLAGATVLLALVAWRRGGLAAPSFRVATPPGADAEAALVARLSAASARAHTARQQGDAEAAAAADAEARDLAAVLRGLRR